MKFANGFGHTLVFVLAMSLACFAGSRGDKKDKEKPGAPQTVDSGSFGVFIKGQRVATETFTVQQQSSGNEIKAQLKGDGVANPVTQKSDLAITSSGDLLHYEWSQSSGGSLTVLRTTIFFWRRSPFRHPTKPRRSLF